jgi:hypothetical protein
VETQVKYFILLKLSILVLGAAVALVLTPTCKAQSEISPDHFDGTDSWARAARSARALAQKQPGAKPSLQAKSQKAAQSSAFQLAAAREVSEPVNREAVAADRKRKPASTDSDKP